MSRGEAADRLSRWPRLPGADSWGLRKKCRGRHFAGSLIEGGESCYRRFCLCRFTARPTPGPNRDALETHSFLKSHGDAGASDLVWVLATVRRATTAPRNIQWGKRPSIQSVRQINFPSPILVLF